MDCFEETIALTSALDAASPVRNARLNAPRRTRGSQKHTWGTLYLISFSCSCRVFAERCRAQVGIGQADVCDIRGGRPLAPPTVDNGPRIQNPDGVS